MPALDPGRGVFQAKSPQSVSSMESVARVKSPSPPKSRTPVKVPERFKSPEPQSKMAEKLRSPEPPQANPSPEQVIKSNREHNGVMVKSTVNGTVNSNIKLPATSNNQMDSKNNQGLTQNKVVKVVRHVVRKVIPTEEDEVTVPTQSRDKAAEEAQPDAEPVQTVPAPAAVSKTPAISVFSFKHDVIKSEDKGDNSRGLTNFIVRGRNRELRPRIRRDEQPQKELEKKYDKDVEIVTLEETKEEKKEEKNTLTPQEVIHKPTCSDRKSVV